MGILYVPPGLQVLAFLGYILRGGTALPDCPLQKLGQFTPAFLCRGGGRAFGLDAPLGAAHSHLPQGGGGEQEMQVQGRGRNPLVGW